MLHITKVMINLYNITDTDFMGYSVDRKTANYHHLLIPIRNGGVKRIKNGAILNQDTAHPYIHVIEYKDYYIFYRVTKEMIEENRKGKLDPENLKRIDDLLKFFERNYCSSTNINGEPLIKEQYTRRLIR